MCAQILFNDCNVCVVFVVGFVLLPVALARFIARSLHLVLTAVDILQPTLYLLTFGGVFTLQ